MKPCSDPELKTLMIVIEKELTGFHTELILKKL
jgi:hypothetical protein